MLVEKNGFKVFTKLVDDATGEYVALRKTLKGLHSQPATDATVDDVLFFKIGDDFYERIRPDSKINASWFLKADGVTDNSPALNKMLNALAGDDQCQIFFPKGDYRFSQTIQLTNIQILMEWEAGAYFVFPPATTGIRVLRTSGREKITLIRPTLYASGMATDGMVMSDNGEYAALRTMAGIADTDVSLFGIGLGLPAQGQAPKLVKSIFPIHYNYHGIESTTIIKIVEPDIAGFSGNGIYLNGRSIYQGYNTSISDISGGGVIKQCGGAGIALSGEDGNQCSIGGGGVLDLRNNGLQGVYDDTMEGNHYTHIHTSTHGWGGFWAIGPSNNCTFVGCYKEGDATYNRFMGYSCVFGGRMVGGNVGSQYAWYQQGNRVGFGSFQSMRVERLLFPGKNDYLDLTVETSPNKDLWHWKVGGEEKNQQLLELFTGNAMMTNGRRADVSGVNMRARYLNGQYECTGIGPDDNNAYVSQISWRPGDKIHYKNPRPWDPPYWLCTRTGLTGNTTYQSIEGLTAQTLPEEPFNQLLLSGTTSFIQTGDVFSVNGNTRTVLTVGNRDGKTTLLLDAPLPNIVAGSQLVYQRAKFQAKGGSKGTTGQLSLRQGEDHGYAYWNYDLNAGAGGIQHWNGTTFV